MNIDPASPTPQNSPIIVAPKPDYSDQKMWPHMSEVARAVYKMMLQIHPEVTAANLALQHDVEITRVPKTSATKRAALKLYRIMVEFADQLEQQSMKKWSVSKNGSVRAIKNHGAAAKMIVLAKGEAGFARLHEKGRVDSTAGDQALNAEKEENVHLKFAPTHQPTRERRALSTPRLVEHLIPKLESSNSDQAKAAVPHLRAYVAENKTAKTAKAA